MERGHERVRDIRRRNIDIQSDVDVHLFDVGSRADIIQNGRS